MNQKYDQTFVDMTTSYQRPPDVVRPALNILDFTGPGFALKSVIEQVIHEAFRARNTPFTPEVQGEMNMAILETFRETMRQIFDFMKSDFASYMRDVESGIKTSSFINEYFRGVENNPVLLSIYMDAVKQAAVATYFILRDVDMFLLFNTFILDNANYDHLIIQCYSESQYPNSALTGIHPGV